MTSSDLLVLCRWFQKQLVMTRIQLMISCGLADSTVPAELIRALRARLRFQGEKDCARK